MQLSLHFQLQSWLLSFHNNFYSETKLSEFLFHTWVSVLWICDNFRIVAIFSTETTRSSKYCWWQAKTESLTWVPVAKTRKITMILSLEQDLTGEFWMNSIYWNMKDILHRRQRHYPSSPKPGTHSTPYGGARAKDGSQVAGSWSLGHGPCHHPSHGPPPQPGQADKITLIVDETR